MEAYGVAMVAKTEADRINAVASARLTGLADSFGGALSQTVTPAVEDLTSALDSARASWDILNGRIKANDEFANLPDKITVAAGEVATAQAELETAITAGNDAAIAAARIRLRDAQAELRDLRTEWTLLRVAMEKPVTIGDIYHPGGKIEPRAGGGSVKAGVPYWVGEGGGYRELFVPRESGDIIAHAAVDRPVVSAVGFGGSGVIHVDRITLELDGQKLTDILDGKLSYRRAR
jgi:hypothetical protein